MKVIEAIELHKFDLSSINQLYVALNEAEKESECSVPDEICQPVESKKKPYPIITNSSDLGTLIKITLNDDAMHNRLENHLGKSAVRPCVEDVRRVVKCKLKAMAKKLSSVDLKQYLEELSVKNKLNLDRSQISALLTISGAKVAV